MFSNDRSNHSNRVERALRPGNLLVLMLIGLGIVFLFGQGVTSGPALADGHEDVAEAENYDETTNEVSKDNEEDSEDERHNECIYVRTIDDFHVIDDRHITVSTGRNRIYLVTLFNRCRQLNWTHQIAIKAHSSWTCSYSKDTIIADGDRCMIDDIERVESLDEAEEIVADRTGADDEASEGDE